MPAPRTTGTMETMCSVIRRSLRNAAASLPPPTTQVRRKPRACISATTEAGVLPGVFFRRARKHPVGLARVRPLGKLQALLIGNPTEEHRLDRGVELGVAVVLAGPSNGFSHSMPPSGVAMKPSRLAAT